MFSHATKHRKLFLCVGGMALFAALAASGYSYVFGNAQAANEPSHVEQSFMTDMTYVDLPRITVSLGNGGSNCMQVDLSLEVARKDALIVESYQPQITDRLNVYFSKLSPEKMGTSTRQASLRKEIILQINKTKIPVIVRGLLFRQMIII